MFWFAHYGIFEYEILPSQVFRKVLGTTTGSSYLDVYGFAIFLKPVYFVPSHTHLYPLPEASVPVLTCFTHISQTQVLPFHDSGDLPVPPRLSLPLSLLHGISFMKYKTEINSRVSTVL